MAVRARSRLGRWLACTSVLVGLLAPLPGASAITPGWTRQFGTTNVDEAVAVSVDPSGSTYVAGWTQGALPSQTSAGMLDAFVRKYDPAGSEEWTRQFGSSDRDYLRGVATDAAGDVYLAGETEGTILGQISAGGRDAFVRKYDPAGNELWTRQFGGAGGDGAAGVALDAAGNVYVVGTTRGTLPGQTSGGDYDAFLRRYDPAGNEVWTRQFGGIEGEGARAVAVGEQGDIIMVGSTDGVLVPTTAGGTTDAFVRRYDSAGTHEWTAQFGGPYIDAAMSVAVDTIGRAFVAGAIERSAGGKQGRGQEAFIHCYDTFGREQWANEFGTESTDMALGVAVAGSVIHLVGSTLGSLPGQTTAGSRDAFVLTLG